MDGAWDAVVSPFMPVKREVIIKRRASESSESQFKSPSKKSRKSTSPSPYDDNEVGPSSSAGVQIRPGQLARIVEELRDRVRTSKRLSSKKFSAFSDFGELDLPNGVTHEVLKADLRRYLKEATSMSSMTVSTGLELLRMFLQDGASVAMDPKFPKRPPNAYMLYMRNRNINSADGNFLAKTAAAWKTELSSEEKASLEKEASDLLEKYLEELVAYSKNHSDLTREQLQYVQSAIDAARKSISKHTGVKNKDNVRRKRVEKKKTPFELFSLSLQTKYADLDPQKRERKLQKKFQKLSDAERNIYEKLASAL